MQEFPVPAEPQQHVSHPGRTASLCVLLQMAFLFLPGVHMSARDKAPDRKIHFLYKILNHGKNPLERMVAAAPSEAFLQCLKVLEFVFFSKSFSI